MLWPWRRKSKKRIARIIIDGPINGSTRKLVLKAVRQVEKREFPALLLRIDSPGGTVGDSQEIYAALIRLKQKGCHVVASFGNISASGGVYVGVAADKIIAIPAGNSLKVATNSGPPDLTKGAIAAMAVPHNANGKTINNQFNFSNMATVWTLFFKIQ